MNNEAYTNLNGQTDAQEYTTELNNHSQNHQECTKVELAEVGLHSKPGEKTTKATQEKVEYDVEEENKFHYDIFQAPPILMTIFFAMQQVLMSLSRSVSTALLIAEIVCARSDENFKARLLSTTMFISGLATFLQNTIGIRLPLYQGPAMTYVIPLLAMQSLPEWYCPDEAAINSAAVLNVTTNSLDISGPQEGGISSIVADRVQRMEGSLMIAGAVHMLVGLTGVVGVLLRFVGPITIIPALTITSLYIYKATTKFAKTQWGIAFLTVFIAMVLSFYLRKRSTPIPAWSRRRGFHIKWFPLHKMFAVLISCLVAWGVSGILTAAGLFTGEKGSDSYFARTDSRLEVIDDTPWFIFPYPGQFGPPGFDTGALTAFMMGTISSIIDSIGDYYACVKVCDAPPPPKHAVNRGIAVEGFMSFLGGWAGAGHATSTFGGNIGAIAITRVASLRVFQLLGIIFILFGVIGKIGAVFVTIPYSVIGGMMMINFGVLIGVMMSNMQFIDMNSTRNLGIIGMSMLIALMLPYWIQANPDGIQTGNATSDSVVKMLLANPTFVAGILACLMDNTIPGTVKERGIQAWKQSLGVDQDDDLPNKMSEKDMIRRERLLETIYIIPWCKRFLSKLPFLKFIPICPR